MERKGLRALCWVLVGMACLLALGPILSVGGVADVGAATAMAQEDDETETEFDDRLDEADEINIDVFVHENGSATFVVDYRFENSTDGDWEAIRDDVEANPSAYTDSQAARWTDVMTDGENATDEDMAIRNVSIATDTSSAPRDLGHVEVTFEWESFAYVQLNRLEVGDALTGFTFPRDTSLQVFAPEGYTIEEVSPTPETRSEDSVSWISDGDPFSSESPMIVMIEASDGTAQTGEDDADAGPSMPWLIVLGALALLATAGVVGWLVRQRRPAGRATASADSASASDPMGTTNDGPPPELLSNEERVLRLLEDHGGRIKQQAVVSELDWTEAKTSQVVSGLREDDEIEVFRIGRENVLALPDDEAEAGRGDENEA